MMKALATHANVGGAVLVSLGCEGFDREGLAAAITQSRRPVETVVIQQAGGTRSSIEAAVAAVRRIQQQMRSAEHTSELQSLMRISYAVFFLTKKNYSYNSLTSIPLSISHHSRPQPHHTIHE